METESLALRFWHMDILNFLFNEYILEEYNQIFLPVKWFFSVKWLNSKSEYMTVIWDYHSVYNRSVPVLQI